MSSEIRPGVLRALAALFLSVAVVHLVLAAHDRVLWPVVFGVLAVVCGLYLEYRAHRVPRQPAERPGGWVLAGGIQIPLSRTSDDLARRPAH